MNAEEKVVAILFSTLLLLLPAAALALATDVEQAVHISADTANFNDRTGIMVYRGNVRVTQGSMVITAETVTTHAPERNLERVIAEGAPATWHQTDDDGREVDAEALRIEYLALENRLILTDDARLLRGNDRFSGARLEYDLTAETIDAVSGEKSRVEVILQPRRGEQ